MALYLIFIWNKSNFKSKKKKFEMILKLALNYLVKVQ